MFEGLESLYKLYGWSGSNNKLKNVNFLSILWHYVCKWLITKSLSQIIPESIEYMTTKTS